LYRYGLCTAADSLCLSGRSVTHNADDAFDNRIQYHYSRYQTDDNELFLLIAKHKRVVLLFAQDANYGSIYSVQKFPFFYPE
jgi:hypothetical protein